MITTRSIAYLVVLFMMMSAAAAEDQGGAGAAKARYDQPAQPLGEALKQLGRTSGYTIMVDSALAQGVTAPSLKGYFTPMEALSLILKSTGLHADYLDAQTVAIRSKEEIGRTTAQGAAAAQMRLAVLGQQDPPLNNNHEEKEDGERAKVAQEVIVTGTLIRNNYRTANVKILEQEDFDAVGAGSIAEVIAALPENFNGVNINTSALTAAFNQNFQAQGRRATRVNTGQAIDGLGTDGLGTAFADLFGLGAGSTLVLIDGRRPASAASSEVGGFNLNNLPLAAVARIEVLPDGASAAYGADAVGGVINIITKKRYSGAESRLRYDESSHDASGYSASQALGFDWNRGSVLMTLSRREKKPFNPVKLGFTSPDLTPQGGFDWSQEASSAYRDPGEGSGAASTVQINNNYRIIVNTPVALASGADPATYASFGWQYLPQRVINLPSGAQVIVPPTAIVDPNNLGHFSFAEVDFAGPIAASGSETRNDAFTLNLQQQIGENIQMYLDASYSKIKASTRALPLVVTLPLRPLLPRDPDDPDSPLTVPNPFYRIDRPDFPDDSSGGFSGPVAPLPEFDVLYSFADESAAGLVPLRSLSDESENMGFTLGADWKLPPEDWLMRSYVSYARSESSNDSVGLDDVALLRLVNSGLFNPLADINDGIDLDNIVRRNPGGQPISEQYLFNTTFDGPVARLPGGTVRAAAGLELRLGRADYSKDPSNFDPGGGAGPQGAFPGSNARLSDPSPQERVRAVFAEFSIPLIGDELRFAGADTLLLSLGARWEEYFFDGIQVAEPGDDPNEPVFATATSQFSKLSPSFGVLWAPHPDLRVSFRWSRSFQVPTVRQLFGNGTSSANAANLAGIEDPNFLGADGNPLPVLSVPGATLVNTLNGGNPRLQPETSDNYSATVTWNPEFLRNFSAALTYSRTDFEDRITSVLFEFPLELGNNDLILLADDSPFPVAVRNANGVLTGFNNRPLNLGAQVSETATLSLGHSFTAADKGTFKTALGVTHFIRLKSQVIPGLTLPGGSVADRVGTNLGPQEWKLNAQIGWQRANLGVTLRGDFSSGYEHVGITFPKSDIARAFEFAPNEHVEHYTFYTLSGHYDLRARGLRFNAGVKNLTGAPLPFFNSPNGNYDLKQDPSGRVIYLEVIKSFGF